MRLLLGKKDINVDLKLVTGSYFVYYIFRNDEVIYIGSSKNLYKRLKEHLYQKEFDFILCVYKYDEQTAKTFEKTEILRLKPIDNTFNKSGYYPPVLKNIDTSISIEDKIKFASVLNR